MNIHHMVIWNSKRQGTEEMMGNVSGRADFSTPLTARFVCTSLSLFLVGVTLAAFRVLTQVGSVCHLSCSGWSAFTTIA